MLIHWHTNSVWITSIKSEVNPISLIPQKPQIQPKTNLRQPQLFSFGLSDITKYSCNLSPWSFWLKNVNPSQTKRMPWKVFCVKNHFMCSFFAVMELPTTNVPNLNDFGFHQCSTKSWSFWKPMNSNCSFANPHVNWLRCQKNHIGFYEIVFQSR